MDRERRVGGAVFIKKGEAIPENATPMSDYEVLLLQERRIANYKPAGDVHVLKYGMYSLSSVVGASGVLINMIIRRNFKLGGLRRMLTYVPAAVFPTFFAAGLHEIGVKRQILLGKGGCPTCVSLRSGVFQALLGVCYPTLVSILACLPIAREFYTLPMPASNSRSGILRLLRQVAPKSGLLLFLLINNLAVGMWVAKREMDTFYKYLSQPPSRQFPDTEEGLFTD